MTVVVKQLVRMFRTSLRPKRGIESQLRLVGGVFAESLAETFVEGNRGLAVRTLDFQ